MRMYFFYYHQPGLGVDDEKAPSQTRLGALTAETEQKFKEKLGNFLAEDAVTTRYGAKWCRSLCNNPKPRYETYGIVPAIDRAA